MHPAFSVIFFSTLTGLGYGVWIWCSLAMLTRRMELAEAAMHAFLLAAAAVPVVAGLISSTFHLGRPFRAWRAFSQWRTSWLSREGVLAVATFVPWAFVVGAIFLDRGEHGPWLRIALALLAVLSAATVVCTAMIYASLTPVPSWARRDVPPIYVGFALLTGGLMVAAATALVVPELPLRVLALLLIAAALVVAKRRAWKDIDRGVLPVTRASALGLPEDRVATVFERPHTEASYLTKEMGFVVARKHAKALRTIAWLAYGAIPVLGCAIALLWPPASPVVLCVAALAALVGTLVERWLFFAEARHLVTLYY